MPPKPPVSQNGWTANDPALVATRLVRGTNLKLKVRIGPAGDLLLEVAARFHVEVEPLDVGQLDDWGYAERPIRGGVELSNHASGTAVDLNATKHPLGTPPAASFTPAQIAAIHRIVDATHGVVRWGGDYTGRPDSMHFEVNDHQTEATCAAALAALRGRGDTVELTDPLPDLFKDDGTKMDVGTSIAWACAHAAFARATADRVEKKLDAVLAQLGEK